MEAVSFKHLKKYVTSIALGSYGVDDRGNVLYFGQARLHGKNITSTTVVRSDEDVKSAQHPKYALLVP
jgi:hypothetical protein